METPMVLGNTLYQLKKYIIDNYGQAFFTDLIKDLDPEIKKILSNAVLSDKFYDVRAKVELVTAFRAVKSEEEAAKMTIAECDSQINWLYSLLLKAINLKQLVSMGNIFWKKNFTTGSQTGELSNDGKKIHMTITTGYKVTPAYTKHLEVYEGRMFEMVGNCKFKSNSRMINDTDIELSYEME